MAAAPIRDRGAAAVLVVLVTTAVIGAALVGLLAVGPVLIDQNRARSAADAAALAGALEGRQAAATVATANGATLVSWDERPGELPGARTVMVEVAVGTVTARARATTDP